MNNEQPVSMTERRGGERHRVTVDVYWQGRYGRSAGTISDINPTGCFVLAVEEVSDGETVHIFIPIDDGVKAQFTGVVTNHEDEIGFALRFDELSETQRSLLERLIRENADA